MSHRQTSLQRFNLVQIGIGLIGRSTIGQYLAHRDRWRDTMQVEFIYRGLIGTDGAVACDDADGYSESTLRRIIEARQAGQRLSAVAPGLGLTVRDQINALTIALAAGPTIVIDTATGDRSAVLVSRALFEGAGAVFSNKAPLALPHGHHAGDAIWSAAGSHGLVRYETSCGAGLPVISTLRTLLDTGDEVIEIVGALSGTLGAIFSDVGQGVPFSEAVKLAKARGYTEPDPRDDLSGLDVARKALILARTIGRPVNLTDIRIESLVPESLKALSVEEFLSQVSMLDGGMAQAAKRADAEGKTLKYVATIRPEGVIEVGIKPIDRSTVLGALQGPENIVSFRTKRYDAYPLTVTGPGAGAEVTAAGVIGDVLALANSNLARTR